MNARRATFFLAALISIALARAAAAEVKMPAIFGDHMVLQGGAQIPVWGVADPAEQITVTLAPDTDSGQTLGGETVVATGVADEAGRWRVQLPGPASGSGTYRLTIEGSRTASPLAFGDVLVGEVWLCSGQSNMEWSVAASANAEEEIAAADHPQIRIFHVARATAGAPKDDVRGSWRVVTPESIGNFSAVAWYFGRHLHDKTKLPVGLIGSSWGGTPVMAWMSPDAFEASGFGEALAGARERIEQLAADPASGNPSSTPTMLYNGMIAPVAPYAVRGFLWYQGESDAWQAQNYAALLRAMIADWRARFEGPDARGPQPFLIVQLANFQQRSQDPAGNDEWARLRAAQSEVAGEPGNGIAITIDIGDAGDIHPRNKQEVGRRLALVALRDVYDLDVEASGPVLHSVAVREGQVVLGFEHAEGLSLRGEAAHAFAVGDAAGNFTWAEAKVEGDEVILTAPGIGTPTVVRYAWQINPPSPLVNGAGLPAGPFEAKLE